MENLGTAILGLITSIGAVIAENPTLADKFGAFGVGVALNALATDYDDLKNAGDSAHQTDAALAALSDGLGAVSGIASLVPGGTIVAGVTALLSATAGAAKLTYDSDQNIASAQQTMSNALAPYNTSNGSLEITSVPPDAQGNTGGPVAVSVPAPGGGTDTVVFAPSSGNSDTAPTQYTQQDVSGSTLTFQEGGHAYTSTVLFQTADGYVVDNVRPVHGGMWFNAANGTGVPNEDVVSITPPPAGSSNNVLLVQPQQNADASVTDTNTILNGAGSDQPNTQYSQTYNPGGSGSVTANGDTVHYNAGAAPQVTEGSNGDIDAGLAPTAGNGLSQSVDMGAGQMSVSEGGSVAASAPTNDVTQDASGGLSFNSKLPSGVTESTNITANGSVSEQLQSNNPATGFSLQENSSSTGSLSPAAIDIDNNNWTPASQSLSSYVGGATSSIDSDAAASEQTSAQNQLASDNTAIANGSAAAPAVNASDLSSLDSDVNAASADEAATVGDMTTNQNVSEAMSVPYAGDAGGVGADGGAPISADYNGEVGGSVGDNLSAPIPVDPSYSIDPINSTNYDPSDPLVFAATGSGINLTSYTESHASYDFTGRGTPAHTGWVGAGTSILVQETGNGIQLPTFSSLASLDSNLDGVINSGDPAFSQLMVWNDANGNGVVDSGELETLPQAGIASISLASTPTTINVGGNLITAEGTLTFTNGTTEALDEVTFASSNRQTLSVQSTDSLNVLQKIASGTEGAVIGAADAVGASMVAMQTMLATDNTNLSNSLQLAKPATSLAYSYFWWDNTYYVYHEGSISYSQPLSVSQINILNIPIWYNPSSGNVVEQATDVLINAPAAAQLSEQAASNAVSSVQTAATDLALTAGDQELADNSALLANISNASASSSLDVTAMDAANQAEKAWQKVFSDIANAETSLQNAFSTISSSQSVVNNAALGTTLQTAASEARANPSYLNTVIGSTYGSTVDALQATYSFTEQRDAAEALASAQTALQTLLTNISQAWGESAVVMAVPGTTMTATGNSLIIAEAGTETFTDSATPNIYAIMPGANVTISNFDAGPGGSCLDFLSGGAQATITTVSNGIQITVGTSMVTLVGVSASALSLIDNLTGIAILNVAGLSNPTSLLMPTSVADFGATQIRTISGVSAENASTMGGVVFNVAVIDTAANVLANLSTLQMLAANGQLSSVVLTDTSTPTFALTAAQFSADSAALQQITSAYNVTVSGVTAANAATVAGNGHVTSLTVSDTGANVAANIAALQTLVTGTKLSSIALTDGPISDQFGNPVSVDSSSTVVSLAQNLLGNGGQDVVLQSPDGNGLVLEFNTSNGSLTGSMAFNLPGGFASGQQIIGSGISFGQIGENDFFTMGANGSIAVYGFNPSNGQYNFGANLVMPNGTPYTLPAGMVAIGAGTGFFNTSGSDLITTNSAGQVNIAEFNGSGQYITGGWLTGPNGVGYFTLPPGTTAIGISENFFDGGGSDLITRNTAGQLNIAEFNAAGQYLIGANLSGTNGTGTFTLAAGMEVIGAGHLFFNKGGADLITRNAEGQVNIAEFSGSGQYRTEATLTGPNGTGTFTMPAGMVAIGVGQDFFNNGGADLITRNAAGQVNIAEFNGSGQYLTGANLSGPNGSTFIVPTNAIALGTGQNFFGSGGSDVVLRTPSGQIYIAEFTATGQYINGEWLWNADGSAFTLAPNATIIRMPQNESGSGYLEQASGQVTAYAFNSTGHLTASNTIADMNLAGQTYNGTLVNTNIDGTAALLAAGATILGATLDTVDLAADVIVENANGTISAMEVNSQNQLVPAIDLHVLGTATNLLGAGGTDALFINANSQLVVYETNGTGPLVGGPITDKFGNPVFVDSSSTVFGLAQNLLGDGGQDVVLQSPDGHGLVLEFNSSGQLLASQALTETAGQNPVIVNGGTLSVTTANEVVLATNATINVAATGAYIVGSGDAISLTGSAETVTVVGSGEPISVTGTGDTVIASNGTVSLNSSASAITIQGTGETINVVTGESVTVTGSGSNTTNLNGNNATLNDQSTGGDTINVNGTGDNVYGSGDTVIGGANASFTVKGTGAGNNITEGNGDSLIVTGSAPNTVTMTGTNATFTDQSSAVTTINVNGAGDIVNGSGDTENGGANASFTANGTGTANTINLASGDSLIVTGSSPDTVNMNGNNDTFTDQSSSTNTIHVYGTGDIITGNSDIEIGGVNASFAVNGNTNNITGASGDIVSIAGSGTTVTASNGTVSVTSTASTITVQGGAETVSIVTGDSVTIDGSVSDTVNLNGNNATVNDATTTTNTINVYGTGDTVNGAGDTINGEANASFAVLRGGNTISEATGDTLTIDGSASDTVNMTGNNATVNDATTTTNTINVYGTGETVNAAGDTINGEANASFTVVRGGNTISEASGDSLIVTGSSADTVTINGTNATFTDQSTAIQTINVNAASDVVHGSSEIIGLGAGATNTSIIGNNESISAATGASLNLSGTGGTITASGDTLYLNAGVTGVTINGNNDTIHIRSGDTYTIHGTGDTVITDTVVNATNGSTIASYNGTSTLVDITNLADDSSITASYANAGHSLVVTDHGVTVATVTLTAFTNEGTLTVRPDGSGGTLVVDPPLILSATDATVPVATQQLFADAWHALTGGTDTAAPSSHDPGQQFVFPDLILTPQTPESHPDPLHDFFNSAPAFLMEDRSQNGLPNEGLVAATAHPQNYADMKFDFSSLPPPPPVADHLDHQLQGLFQHAAALVGDSSMHQMAAIGSPTEPDPHHMVAAHLASAHDWHF